MTDRSESEINSAIVQAGRWQYGMVTRSQLLDLGISERRIATRVDTRRLLPIGRAVFAIGRKAEGLHAAYMAAVLSCGPNAYLSGRAAAELWGFMRYSGEIQVTRTSGRKPSAFRLDRRGITDPRLVRVRYTRTMPMNDRARRTGVPVLSPSRILLDLAGELPFEALKRAFNEADRLQLLNKSMLLDCASRGKGWTGIGEFRKLVARRHPKTQFTRTLLETLFLNLCVEYDIATPQVNVRDGRYFPDFSWPGINLIVEVDGYAGHAGRMAFLDDAHRENELRHQGKQVLRFTWEEVTERPGWVASLVKKEKQRCEALSALALDL